MLKEVDVPSNTAFLKSEEVSSTETGTAIYSAAGISYKLAKVFGLFAGRNQHVSWVLFSGVDYFLYQLYSDGIIASESQRKLISTGVLGYMWGASVIVDSLVPEGIIYVSSAENREEVFSHKDKLITVVIPIR